MLIGLLIFFVLEKLVLWRHCHQEVCEGHTPHVHAHAHDNGRDTASASLVLIGDGFHNMLDGVLIAAAFMTDVHLGVVTAIAVFAHEIPQEVGDLAILLHSGMSRTRALTLNLLTSLTFGDRRRRRVLRLRESRAPAALRASSSPLRASFTSPSPT